MWLFRRTIRLICPACGREAKLAARIVRAQEAESCPYPGQPPELECPWCHSRQMGPLKYRFSSGETFRLPAAIVRRLRRLRKAGQILTKL
jgi:hypothetical protein